jgi:cytochrome P450 enzyme
MSTEPLIFNPVDPAFVADPYPFFRRLRSEAPVYWWERGHMWLFTKHADVEATLKSQRFSSDARDWRFHRSQVGEALPPEVAEYFENRLFHLAPSDHTRMRKIVSGSFTPRAAAQREALVQELVDELLDEIEASEGFDFMTSFANQLPSRVIGRILGIPSQYEPQFSQWSDALLRTTLPMLPPEQYMATIRQLVPGFALIRQVIDERRRRPGDDLLSSLIEAQEQGDRLSEGELVALVGGLVTGGSETTIHLLGFSLLELLRNPDVKARVIADPELLAGVIEETLRHDNFGTMGVPRYALEDVEVRGQSIVKGDMVMCMLAAAMHDEEVWPDAERFDIDRDPIRNLAFGRGPHFCLGVHLARVEARVALRAVLARFPKLELAAPPSFRPHPFLRVMQSLPLRPQPAA